jgi:hypothetical protein
MARLNARHLDNERRLRPRDYATHPGLFGVDPDLEFRCPDGGDSVSKRVAEQTHRLLCRWNRERRPSAAALAERYGTSKQTLSEVSRGLRWPGETILAALHDADERRRLGRGRPAPTDAAGVAAEP